MNLHLEKGTIIAFGNSSSQITCGGCLKFLGN